MQTFGGSSVSPKSMRITKIQNWYSCSSAHLRQDIRELFLSNESSRRCDDGKNSISRVTSVSSRGVAAGHEACC